MERVTNMENETITFNFYATNRHDIPGVHPSEYMEESVDFKCDGGEYAAANERAIQLLKVWRLADGVRVHESGTNGNDDWSVSR
jgi:hypothetical protein